MGLEFVGHNYLLLYRFHQEYNYFYYHQKVRYHEDFHSDLYQNQYFLDFFAIKISYIHYIGLYNYYPLKKIYKQ